MDIKTRLQISYIALGVSVAIALAELAASLAKISIGPGWAAPFIRMAGILWAPAFYAVAVYRRALAREQEGGN